jgi:hypothetical protein
MLGKAVFGTKFAPFPDLIHEGLTLTKNEQISKREEKGEDLRGRILQLDQFSRIERMSDLWVVK